MMGATHQMFALLAALWFLTWRPLEPGLAVALLSTIAVMIGALTPDLDQPTANIWKRMLGGRTLGNIFDFFSGGHRHLTHSLVGIILIGFGTHWLITNLVVLEFRASALIIWSAYLIGYISHPIADTLTDRGVPWFWPLHWNVKVPPGPEEVRVTTNSWVEVLLVRGGIVVAAAFLLASHWQVIAQFYW